jgi:hypothetical protein
MDVKGLDKFLNMLLILAFVGLFSLIGGGVWVVWWIIKHLSITVH